MKDYIKLIRVKHYIKNILIFLPIFFSKNILNVNMIISVLIGFISFSFMASVIYIINDIRDIEKDKMHPVKKNRPLASGAISKKKAILLAILLLLISIGILFFIEPEFRYNSLIFACIYFLLNIAYSFGLKNKPIIDIVILASGFVLRVLFGGSIIGVEISSWLYLTIFAISFYLGLGKRRNEYIKHKDDDTRSVLKFYNKEFLDKNMYMCVALAIAFYALWAKDYSNTSMIWTVPVVMIMAMRYSYNIENKESEGDPTDILVKDKIMWLLGLVYLVITCLGLYL